MGPFRVMDRGWDLEAGDHNLVCFAALSASFIFIFSVCFFLCNADHLFLIDYS